MTVNKLFNEDEWNAMVSTSHEIISAQVTDHLGILHTMACVRILVLLELSKCLL